MIATNRGTARCAAAAVLFGATTPLASRVADDTSAPVLAGLLYIGAAFFVAPTALRHRPDPAAVRRGLGPLGLAVVAGGFLGPLLLAAGMSRTPAATASLLLNLELVATTILAATLFREHLGSRIVTGTAGVVSASVLLVWTDAPELRIGALCIVGACLCWGLDNCVTATLDEIRPEHITFAKGLVAGTTNLVLGLSVAAATDRPSTGLVAGALLIGALGYGASITLWVAGARDLGAARGQLVFSAAPFVGVLVAWLVLGDSIRPAEAGAVLVAGFGVSRVLASQHHHPHGHDPVDHDHEHGHHDAHHEHRHADADLGLVHTHRHRHEPMTHAHPHVPDIHHRHLHTG